MQSLSFQILTGLQCSLVLDLGIGLAVLWSSRAHYAFKFRCNSSKKMLSFRRANLAMNLTYLHWGFHGWAIYAVVGLCFAYFTFNKNLPFRVSSFFSGAFTDRVWGRVSLDMIAIIATIFGIATSLGLGANQINSGLGYMGVSKKAFLSTVWIIIFITLLGLISVVLVCKLELKDCLNST
jgi:choline/glycine/proline betaine transport protein